MQAQQIQQIYAQQAIQIQALQRELARIKQELAAERALSVSIKHNPISSSTSKGKQPARKHVQTPNNDSINKEPSLRRHREQTTFSMREQTPAQPTAAQQEAAAVRYLAFVEDMTKLGRKRAQFKFPSLTGKANYRAWAQNVKQLMNQHLLEQIIEGQAGSLPVHHPQYYSLRVLKGDAQLMIANAVSAKINENLRFSKDPEPERIWKSLKDQYETC
ncbi:hypothetical protein PITC_061830 [Penicillium italicum]|uniref:Uncharacterized protein n=1 Tax=Penicillium italicum TaxID=40296 RepID=A0A0A2L8L0_PENIT|nr:hypothetical protein PITC_061830 [Penicillium italicum]